MIQQSIVAVVRHQKRNGASITSPKYAVPTYVHGPSHTEQCLRLSEVRKVYLLAQRLVAEASAQSEDSR